jgi:hypothetical protein
LAAAIPVIENNPAPITAPIPKATNENDPSVRFNVCVPVSDASPSNVLIGFLINKLIIIVGFFIKIWKSKE